MQVVGHDDDVEAALAERRRRHALEIQATARSGSPARAARRVQRRDGRGVAIDGRSCEKPCRGEPHRVAAAAARHVERTAATGQQRAVRSRARRPARSLETSSSHQSAVSAPRDRLPRHPARRPRPLEVEAAEPPVHVEDLAHEVEARLPPRLHRRGVDLVERNASGGDLGVGVAAAVARRRAACPPARAPAGADPRASGATS